MHEAHSHFLSLGSAMLMTERGNGWQLVFSLCISVLFPCPQIFASQFPRIRSRVGGTHEAASKAADVKGETCGSAVWRLRSTSLVVNVSRKAVYNISLQLLHRMSTVQAVTVQFPLMGLQLWESFFHFLT